MNEYFKSIILKSTGATSLHHIETIQNLWSGYGQIMRMGLKNAAVKSVVVKHVQLPKGSDHPRGWNTDISHQRKVASYNIEATWYDNYSVKSTARLPFCYATKRQDNEVLIVLEDLNQSGYPSRKRTIAWYEINSCLSWLAKFHTSYLDEIPKGLWENGTYWHLETRPQELDALKDHKLKKAAATIDDKLNSCKHKTLVHGDAKLANFCFAQDGKVAGVDFQYVGGGCGMKDVAYFVGSCLNEVECEHLEAQILDTYFEHFQNELMERNVALEKEWRSLYRVAWADFHRFIKGWSPGHWKINSYSERITTEVIDSLI